MEARGGPVVLAVLVVLVVLVMMVVGVMVVDACRTMRDWSG